MAVQVDGRVHRFRSSVGFVYLAHLLAHPRQEVAAIALFAGVRGHDVVPRGDAGEVLDERAREAYRRRLDDLRQDLAEAEAHQDLGRQERTAAEIDILTEQLRAAVGLGGRARVVGSVAERARVAVTQRIRHAIGRIGSIWPEVAAHLQDAVRTGGHCVYEPSRGPQPEPGPPGGAPRRLAMASRVLSGREAELAAIGGAWAEVSDGARRVVWLWGAAGLGKSTLLERARESLGGACLHVQCGSSASRVEPHAAVLEALANWAHASPRAALRLLDRWAPSWLLLLPWLLPPEGLEALHLRTLGGSAERMTRELVDTVGALAENAPVAVLIDDVHNASDGVLAFLDALLQRRGQGRVLVLVSCRAGEPTPHAVRLDDLERRSASAGQALRLDLRGLGRRDVEAYLSARFPAHTFAPALAGRIHERTEGNPLFVTSLVDELLASGLIARVEQRWTMAADPAVIDALIPAEIGRFVLGQLGALPASTARLLRAACAVGPIFSAAAVAAALERPVEDVDRECDWLAQGSRFLHRAGLARWPDGTLAGQFRFRHALHHSVLQDHVSLRERAVFHGRIADRLEAAYATDSAPVAAELAAHLLAAQEPERALPHLLDAVRQCSARQALAQASAHLSVALALAEGAGVPGLRLRVLAERARVLALMGSPACLDDCRTLIDEARRQGELGWLVRGLLSLAWNLPLVDATIALSLYDEACAVAARLGAPELEAEAQALRAYWRSLYHRFHASDVQVLRDAIRVLRRRDPAGHLPQLQACLCHVLFSSSDHESAVRAAERASEGALRAGTWHHYGLAQVIGAEAEAMLGLLGRSHGRAVRNEAIFVDNGNSMGAGLLVQTQALVAHLALDHERALALAERSLTLGDATGMPLVQWRAHVLAATALAALGQPTRARPHLTRADSFVPRMDLVARLWLGLAHVDTSLALGDLARASTHADVLAALAETSGERSFLTLAACARAEIALATDDPGQAHRALDDARALAVAGTSPHALLRLHAASGRLAVMTGQSPAPSLDARLALLRRLRASLRGTDVPTEALDRELERVGKSSPWCDPDRCMGDRLRL